MIRCMYCVYIYQVVRGLIVGGATIMYCPIRRTKLRSDSGSHYMGASDETFLMNLGSYANRDSCGAKNGPKCKFYKV